MKLRQIALRTASGICFLVLTHHQHSAKSMAAPPIAADSHEQPTDMRHWIEQFTADRNDLNYKYRSELDSERFTRFQSEYAGWLAAMDQVDFDPMSIENQVDYLLLRNHIRHELQLLQADEKRDSEAIRLIPFWTEIIDFIRTRDQMKKAEGADAATTLHNVSTQSDSLKKAIENGEYKEFDPIVALRAAERINHLRERMAETHRFYDGYDPVYSWWCKEPFANADQSLTQLAKIVRSSVAGIPENDKDRIVGLPIGEQALLDELAFEHIPYSPSELVRIAEREFAWCDTEMEKAATEMGFDDWRDAQEKVKTLHVDPGDQPEMIRELAWEAIQFLQQNDLVTVPPLAADTWRMDMMSPERQRLNPFFLGGPSIIVSFPTDSMTHPEKLMSMRGNNIHFARATVHHELIPGHRLQYFMKERYRPYRKVFSTPFWIEGWALYWEMRLYDMDFAKSAEDRVGMLFWRKHRCARIIFSLNYQLGRWSPEQCIEFLISRVGHEPANAAAEVRRSVMGGYGPLYQAAYMLGGLQIRELRQQLVGTGKMTDRQFHDAVLQQNSIPIELLRAQLTRQPLTKDFRTIWRFAGEPQATEQPAAK
ncbi:MAG: DUF885 family protein [Planctomycetaceae bacterium]|nr:DUF885 family protein [Planctomycetaceae bacterium]